MANESSAYPPAYFIYIVVGSVDHLIGVPVNCWALWLVVSGKPSLIQSELLTLNLVIMEILCSVCFFLSPIEKFGNVSSIRPLLAFYRVVAVAGRALFQCQVCVDRYLAVIHPVVFIRFKQIQYRGACLAAVWMVVISSGLINVYKPPDAELFSIWSFVLLLPAFITELYCSLCIIRVLRRPSPGSKEAHEKKEGNQQKKRAVRIICIMLVMLVLNLVPFIVVPFFLRITYDVLATAFTLSTIGSSVQAFLFLSRSGELPCTGKI